MGRSSTYAPGRAAPMSGRLHVEERRPAVLARIDVREDDEMQYWMERHRLGGSARF
jgi:hypothetical protein